MPVNNELKDIYKCTKDLRNDKAIKELLNKNKREMNKSTDRNVNLLEEE